MLAVLIIFLIIVGVVKVYYLDAFRQTSDLAHVAPIRELVLNSSKGTKTNAAVDPKTGDQYFPEAKLYVPAAHVQGERLTYDVSSSQGKIEISVSSQTVFEHAAAKLYQAKDSEQMFRGVPELQACQRGVSLSYTPLSGDHADGKKLHQAVRLNNGKMLHMYAENCTELRSVVDVLKHIRAY